MIRYGLKLWTKNRDQFDEAAERFRQGAFDFIEFYYHPDFPLDADALRPLVGIPIGIHAPHALDDFLFGERELALWNDTKALAEVSNSRTIVVHPGYADTISGVEDFERELAKIDDERILIEAMPGKDATGRVLFGYDLPTLKRIHDKKPVCLDVEKNIKAAVYQRLDWKSYFHDSIEALQPTYFHISGCTTTHDIDQHADLWDGDVDWSFVKRALESVPGEIRLVFETPKNGRDLQNDLDNMSFFRKLTS